MQISSSVEALVHVSEMSDDETVDPEKLFQLNEKKQFKVLDIDTESRKIALSLKEAKASSKTKTKTKTKTTTTKAAKPAAKTTKPKK